jgi:hypothetical protein
MYCAVCDVETDEPIEGWERLDHGVPESTPVYLCPPCSLATGDPDPKIRTVRYRDGQWRLCA